ncbi:hypothetical protein [Terriglobus sp.]|uniref:hypothetical protein n=1 Tax=Terriglobus sp. TaxID=1889013 RepID=UPI003B00F400
MHPNDYVKRLLPYCALLAFLSAAAQGRAAAQANDAALDLRALIRDVCRGQIEMLQRHDTRLRYQIQRTDHKGSTLRDEIESHDGNVARLLQHDGRALTPEEDTGEHERLNGLLGSDKLQQRERDEAKARIYGVEMLQVLPDAMRFTLAAMQTPLPDVADRQVVVDFEPDPAFHPANMTQQILPALRGRLWVDVADHHLLRMEAHNTSDVNLAWGLLAKVHAGGSILYEQRRFQDLYTFTHIALHLRLRELMVKAVLLDTDTLTGDFQRLPSSPSGDDAVRMLLAKPVPTR